MCGGSPIVSSVSVGVTGADGLVVLSESYTRQGYGGRSWWTYAMGGPMTTRTAGDGRTVVRRARGALLVLCAVLAALAVLAHHETTSVPADHSPMSAAHTAAVHGMAVHTAVHGTAAPGTAAPGMRTAALAGTPAPAHGPGGCATAGAQHCASAGVVSAPLLAVPGEHGLAPLAGPARAMAGRVPAGTTGRAPPDLSVLSRLHI